MLETFSVAFRVFQDDIPSEAVSRATLLGDSAHGNRFFFKRLKKFS